MKYSICILCAGVSGAWLLLSAGMAWGDLDVSVFMLPTALLMGGSVIGIANKIKDLPLKIFTVAMGMAIAYMLLVNLGKTAVIIELILMIFLAHALFKVKEVPAGAGSSTPKELTKKLADCCD